MFSLQIKRKTPHKTKFKKTTCCECGVEEPIWHYCMFLYISEKDQISGRPNNYFRTEFNTNLEKDLMMPIMPNLNQIIFADTFSICCISPSLPESSAHGYVHMHKIASC